MTAIIVHGGAGHVETEHVADMLMGCRVAALVGWRILREGGGAVDAVEAAVAALEDNPLFNAGTGATLNAAGGVQLDASIMDGNLLTAGAVAAVSRLRNPIRLARKIMDDGRHVLLVGTGALEFARSIGMVECDEQDLIVEPERRRWQEKYGTVGCVALDSQGRLAAGTSTGGRFGMLPGRVGDSPLIGCGTYADQNGGVSCTGIGEAIIRTGLARSAIERIKAALPAQRAAEETVAELQTLTASKAGLIVIDRAGHIGYACNTSHMPVCLITPDGNIVTDI